jgi:membrane protease YdiL (CAAX protease family)
LGNRENIILPGESGLILKEIIEAIINVIIFLTIPFLYWFFTSKNKTTFFSWVGLKKPLIARKKKFYALFFLSVIVYSCISLILDSILPNTIQSASKRFYGLGMRAFIPALIFAFLKTALAEEIFFRGFLGKRLHRLFGFAAGNAVQAAVFGFLHGAALLENFGLAIALGVFAFTGSIGWIAGYIDEKESDGSIVPSLLLHGIANTFACIADMFQFVR